MFKFLPSYIYSHDEHLPADRDYPTERLMYKHYMYGSLDRVMVVNKKSDKVYVNVARTGV